MAGHGQPHCCGAVSHVVVGCCCYLVGDRATCAIAFAFFQRSGRQPQHRISTLKVAWLFRCFGLHAVLAACAVGFRLARAVYVPGVVAG